MYEKELMMAILTASTMLVGLTGVVMGQIRSIDVLSYRREFWLIACLLISLLSGLLTVVTAIVWFGAPDNCVKLATIILFGFQFVLFIVVASIFWLTCKPRK